MELETQILQKKGFQVLKPIGHGGFGNVYLVYKEDLGLVAAKLMKESDFDYNEWKVGLALGRENKNPFALKYFEQFSTSDTEVLLIEYANLGNLQSLIETKQDLPPGIIRVIMKQLLEGLHLMHEKGLIHRDIKGENILLHSPFGSGRVILKISDFGLIKVQKQAQQSTLLTVAGTAPFLAPEMLIESDDDEEGIEGQVKADAKVDVWSSGILLYQLVAHCFPFKSPTLPVIINNSELGLRQIIKRIEEYQQ
ncbi:MAG: putative AGC family protein kinase [Streblomastix strix]|uniref:Putative AGC family protein kinase n=1 Tax=Streblomastix strix TaxID=222440 RepID=A0A5J4VX54_9EUKA|nr:MAG: putative AGC family protein kinase [Streblomastix strix]